MIDLSWNGIVFILVFGSEWSLTTLWWIRASVCTSHTKWVGKGRTGKHQKHVGVPQGVVQWEVEVEDGSQVEETPQKWGIEMGKDKGPPAHSGSFCEAVGVVSEAREVEPWMNSWMKRLNQWVPGKKAKGKEGFGATEDMSRSPKKPQNDPLSTVPRCASLSASFYSDAFWSLHCFLTETPTTVQSDCILTAYVYISNMWCFG